MLCDGLPQEGRAALRHVAVETIRVRLILHRRVQGGDHRGAQGLGNVADAHAVQVLFGICLRVSFRFLCDPIEEIRLLQIGIVHIRSNHCTVSPS